MKNTKEGIKPVKLSYEELKKLIDNERKIINDDLDRKREDKIRLVKQELKEISQEGLFNGGC